MAKALVMTDGVPVMTEIVTAALAPVDDTLLVVVGAPGNANEITGPIIAGTPITLPNGLSYETGQLEVTISGQTVLRDTASGWNEIGSGTKTQISFNKDLDIDDEIGFRRD